MAAAPVYSTDGVHVLRDGKHLRDGRDAADAQAIADRLNAAMANKKPCC